MPTAQRRWSISPRPRGLLVITLLAITNVATAALLVRTWFDGWVARDELYGFATYAGSMQAHADYCNGVLREYELSTEGRDFTGRRDGPFQIWRWTYYPDLGRSDRFANHAFVEAYNTRMRFMQAHPDQWKPNEMGGHNPDGGPSMGSAESGATP